jgi:hypothetical protein
VCFNWPHDCAACSDLQLIEVKLENMIHEHGSKLNRFISIANPILLAGINQFGVLTWVFGALTWSRGCDLEPGL